MAKRKGRKDKQGSTNATQKNKDRVTRTPLKTGCEMQTRCKTITFCNLIFKY